MTFLREIIGEQNTILGGIARFTPSMPDTFTKNGMRFIRSGILETNNANFDSSLSLRGTGLGLEVKNTGLTAANLTTMTAYNDKIVVAYSASSNRVAYSGNGGSTWSDISLPNSNGAVWTHYAPDDGKFYLLQSGGNIFSFNSDGSGFTLVDDFVVNGAQHNSFVKFGSAYFVTVNNSIYRSTDLTTWTQIYTNASVTAFTRLRVCGNTLVAVHNTSNTTLGVAYSTDGTTWQLSASLLPVQYIMNDVTFFNGQIVALVTATAPIFVSTTDFTKWLTFSILPSQGQALSISTNTSIIATPYGIVTGNNSQTIATIDYDGSFSLNVLPKVDSTGVVGTFNGWVEYDPVTNRLVAGYRSGTGTNTLYVGRDVAGCPFISNNAFMRIK